MPDNFIAFELPSVREDWWYDIFDGSDSFTVTDSHITPPDSPGLGLNFIPEVAKQYLSDEYAGFFDD
jgi:L-alanine-DL-glutamate epimerase-like enolase superfamily enzyme